MALRAPLIVYYFHVIFIYMYTLLPVTLYYLLFCIFFCVCVNELIKKKKKKKKEEKKNYLSPPHSTPFLFVHIQAC